MDLRSLLLSCVTMALLLPPSLGKEVHVEWTREFALQHDVNSPLEVVAGDKLLIDCPEGTEASVLPVNSTIAEQCNMEGGVRIQADFSQYLADCVQNCIALLHQGMPGSGYNYVPGHTYFFGDAPLQTSVCQFSIAVRVKENCSNAGVNPACTESTSSMPQPSSAITPTATIIQTTPTASPLLCPSSNPSCSGHALQPHLLTLIIVCALTLATIVTSS